MILILCPVVIKLTMVNKLELISTSYNKKHTSYKKIEKSNFK